MKEDKPLVETRQLRLSEDFAERALAYDQLATEPPLRRRDGNTEGLRYVLYSIKPEEFLSSVWGQRPHLDRPAEPERFRRLLTWDDLDHALDTQRAWPARVNVVRGGKQVPPSHYLEPVPGRGQGRDPLMRVNSQLLHRQLASGATLVFFSADEVFPEVRDLADQLQYELQADVFVNLYLARGDVGGFEAHWDDHDTFILQVHGAKEWRLFGEGRRLPLPKDSEPNECPEKPVDELVLQQGEALYVPRGWWHAVRPIGEETLHLTLGIGRPSGIDFLRWAAERQRAHEPVRRDLPLTGTDSQIRRFLETMHGYLCETLTPTGWAQFVSEHNGRVQARPVHNTAMASTSGTRQELDRARRLRLRAPRPIQVYAVDGDFSFASGGLVYQINERAWPLVRAILERRVGTIADFFTQKGELSDDQGREVLVSLLGAGLLGWSRDKSARQSDAV